MRTVPADFVCSLLLLLSATDSIPDRYMLTAAPRPVPRQASPSSSPDMLVHYIPFYSSNSNTATWNLGVSFISMTVPVLVFNRSAFLKFPLMPRACSIV